MLPNPRDERLANEYRLLSEFVGWKKNIVIELIEGNPPDYYVVAFSSCGIVRLEGDSPIYSNEHRIEITLPAEFPGHGPILNWLTPIFHPNFYDDGNVCISTWAPGRTLVAVCHQLDDMIAYRNFDPHDDIGNAPNKDAAEWVLKHLDLIPISGGQC